MKLEHHRCSLRLATSAMRGLDRCHMSLAPANLGRILAGVVLLFGAWCLGGYVGEAICPGTILVGGRESLAGKIGCSVAILAATVIARRFLLRSLVLALMCLGVTEVVVLLIILGVSGLTSFSMADFRFNGWWLYALTWNVVVAFAFGVAIGHWWDKQATNPKRCIAAERGRVRLPFAH